MPRCKAPDVKCNFEGTNIELQSHAFNEHELNIELCFICDKLFWDVQSLADHHRDIHSGKGDCDFCSKAVDCYKDYCDHAKDEHPVSLGYFTPSSSVLAEPTTAAPETSLLEKLISLGISEKPEKRFLIERSNYLALHDEEKLVWGFEVLTKSKLENKVVINSVSTRDYRWDPKITYNQPSPWGIDVAGFHCGHVSPVANNRHCKQAFKECMLMGNVVPQHGQFNLSINSIMENHCRKLTDYWPSVPVITIPIYNEDHHHEETIDCTDIHIADSFGKIVVLERPGFEQKLAQVFNLPHEDDLPKIPIYSYRSTLTELANLCGIKFLSDKYVCSWDVDKTVTKETPVASTSKASALCSSQLKKTTSHEKNTRRSPQPSTSGYNRKRKPEELESSSSSSDEELEYCDSDSDFDYL